MSDREESSEENQIRVDGYRKQKSHSRENSQERHWLHGPETWRGLSEKEGTSHVTLGGEDSQADWGVWRGPQSL